MNYRRFCLLSLTGTYFLTHKRDNANYEQIDSRTWSLAERDFHPVVTLIFPENSLTRLISDCPEDRYTAKPFSLEKRMIFKRDPESETRRVELWRSFDVASRETLLKSHPRGCLKSVTDQTCTSAYARTVAIFAVIREIASFSILNGEFQNSLCQPASVLNLSILSLRIGFD